MNYPVFVYGNFMPGQYLFDALAEEIKDYKTGATTVGRLFVDRASKQVYALSAPWCRGNDLIHGALLFPGDAIREKIDKMQTQEGLFKRKLSIITLSVEGTTLTAWVYWADERYLTSPHLERIEHGSYEKYSRWSC